MRRSFTPVSLLMLAAIGMLALSACAAPASAQANAAPTLPQTGTPATPADLTRTIAVSGAGTAYAAPDVATAQIGVQTRDADAVKAVGANTAKMTAIIAALKVQGIAEKDIQTTNFSVSAQQDVDQNGQPRGTMTFIVENMVSITVHDLTKVGQVLSASVDAGANSIFGVSYSVADRTALEGQARDKAMADAKARAAQLAKDAGTTLDGPITISENVSNEPVQYYAARNAGPVAAGSAPVPLQSGQISVQIQVQVTYQMH